MESPKYEATEWTCPHCGGDILAKLVLNINPATGNRYGYDTSPYILKWHVCNKCKTLFDEMEPAELTGLTV